MHKLGINLDAVQGIPYEELIKIIKELGFSATFTDMTFCNDIERVAELCDFYGMEYSFIHAPYKGTNNIWHNGTEGEEMLKSILSCIDRCSNIGVPIAVVHISSGFTPPPMSELGKDRFRRIVERGEEKGVKIAFENLRAPRYLKWAMDTFKGDSVGFCWDIGHENCFTKGIEYMTLYGQRLLCTHIHDNFKILGGDAHIIPFDGKINYKKAMRHIKNSSFRGPLMLEVLNKNEIYSEMTPIEFLNRAYNSIEKIQKLTLD